MKKLNLFIAIIMALVTTIAIVLFLFTRDFSKKNAEIITMMSIFGYLISATFYHHYKTSKDIG